MAGFAISYGLKGYGLFHEFRAAEILEENGYRSCIVGDAAALVYGSDLMISDIHIAVTDEQIQDARTTLLSHGFLELPQLDRFKVRGPTKDNSAGWPGFRLMHPTHSKSVNGAAVLLIPASFWHLELNYKNYSSVTHIYPGSSCRFPDLLFYIDALIDVLTERIPDEQYNGRITRYLEYLYYIMVVLPLAQPLSRLAVENQFFFEFFRLMIRPLAKGIVCQLRQMIREGAISPEAARTLVPKLDLKLAAIKKQHPKIAN